MIQISCKDTLYTYNIYHLIKAFFPEERIEQNVNEEQESLADLVFPGGSCFSVTEKMAEEETAKIRYTAGLPDTEGRQEKKKCVTRILYRYLRGKTEKELAWGMLTGVRPTKLAMYQIENNIQPKDAIEFLKQEYYVSQAKAELAVEIALREKALLEPLDVRDGFSLYVGIPFCPSICSYCSFSSSLAKRWAGRMEDYLDALCLELEAIGRMSRGKKLNTVYIGGGTPTTLTPEQLERLLGQIDAIFSYENLLEYTVEAGRPDSITREKLEVLRSHPVSRISINPQTMQQRTLELVGRQHTVEQVYEAFALARETGFDNINMDLIAGLPGETAADMQDTLRQIERLAPDSLTVHSLAIKRAARMNRDERPAELSGEIARMVEDSAAAARRMGLEPYYLYRQKNIAGNFENVGYAKVDKAGIYNILIMEEKQTILAAGAGATTKMVLPGDVTLDGKKKTNLIRTENIKDVTEYISRIKEMTERKGELVWH